MHLLCFRASSQCLVFTVQPLNGGLASGRGAVDFRWQQSSFTIVFVPFRYCFNDCGAMLVGSVDHCGT